MITLTELKSATNTSEGLLKPLYPYLMEELKRNHINTPLRVQHFLAQIIHESGGFKLRVENLNYSAEGLRKIFPKYFNVDQAIMYARQPEKIANRVYSNRMGNGDEASGEGWMYRGRGAIQLTGKYNYNLLTRHTNIDFIEFPDRLIKDEFFFMGAGWFWQIHNLNALADKNDLTAIRKKINGGTIGIEDCNMYLQRLKHLMA